MRWGIISDIHANYEALEAVLAALDKEDVDKLLCPGDLVGYGANPKQCITEIKKIKALIIAGNHDWASADNFDISYFNPVAQTAVLWTRKCLSAGDKKFLQNLELLYQQDSLTMVHGSLNCPSEFGYIFNIHEAKQTFDLLQTEICFVGHSHAPVVFINDGKKVTCSLESKIELQKSHSYIVNAGSVGQPRDANPQATYVIYDQKKASLEIKRVAYDVQKAQQKIIKAGLPRILAERLALGR